MSTLVGYRYSQYHVKFKFSGSKEKIEFFNSILSDTDTDWPYTDQGEVKAIVQKCPKCSGVIYLQPRWTPRQILWLIDQVNESFEPPGHLKVRIKRFCTEAICKGKE
jgi:hypothetical protein